MTIHFVYAKGVRTGAPQSITSELALRLGAASEFGAVRVYDLGEVRKIVPEKGDILLGHPHQDPRTVFRASMNHPGWKRRVVMCPFSHGIPSQWGWMDEVVESADLFLAITGKYWHETMAESLFSHWRYKSRQLDLALNRKWYPPVKSGATDGANRWNARGKRRFLYIGYPGPAKGTDYLCELAAVNRTLHIGWMGWGFLGSPYISVEGPCDFFLPESYPVIGSYDFLLTCGRSDANPATILEAVAWGLVPVCTPQSGYRNEPWLVNIPLNDVPGASAVLQRLNLAAEAELDALVARGRTELDRHYNWDRFAKDVIAAFHEPLPERPRDKEWETRASENRKLLRAAK